MLLLIIFNINIVIYKVNSKYNVYNVSQYWTVSNSYKSTICYKKFRYRYTGYCVWDPITMANKKLNQLLLCENNINKLLSLYLYLIIISRAN